MATLLWSRTTAVWGLLVGATFMSWIVGHGVGLSDARQAGLVVLLVAILKVYLVFQEFMEVRTAPRGLRYGVAIWLASVGGAMLILFWLGAGGAGSTPWPRLPGL